LDHGSGFGELALLYNDKRSATIQAVTDCETYTLEGSIFKAIVVKSSVERRRSRVQFLNQVKLLHSLDKFDKLKIVDGLEQSTFYKGDYIIKEGDKTDDFYIIEEGKVECLKNIQNETSGQETSL
jgi:CRP-like cAMP-binding protein